MVTTSNAQLDAVRRPFLTPTLILITVVSAIMGSLGAPLIPSIALDSNVSLGTANWLITIALLVAALCTPVLGKLADGRRQKWVIIGGLAVTMLGSALAGWTSSFPLLVVARGMQGVGMGLFPVITAIARRVLPPAQAHRTIAILAASIGIGAGLGYPVTGLLARIADYHWAFWFGALVVGIGLLLVICFVPEGTTSPVRGPFDVVGALSLSLCTSSLVIGLSEGSRWGWLSAVTIGVFALSVVSGCVLVVAELHRADPFVDVRLVRNRLVATADSAGFLVSVAMYLCLPVVVEFIQVPPSAGYGFGASVLTAGCTLLPVSVGTYLAARLTPFARRLLGQRSVIPLGALLYASAMIFFAVEHTALWEALVVTFGAGLAMGFTFAAMPAYIMSAVGPGDTGSAMGFYQVLRSIGLAAGSAVSVLIFAHYTPIGAHLPAVGGFRLTLLFGAALCILTAVITTVLPGRALALHAAPDDVATENAELGGNAVPSAGDLPRAAG